MDLDDHVHGCIFPPWFCWQVGMILVHFIRRGFLCCVYCIWCEVTFRVAQASAYFVVVLFLRDIDMHVIFDLVAHGVECCDCANFSCVLMSRMLSHWRLARTVCGHSASWCVGVCGMRDHQFWVFYFFDVCDCCRLFVPWGECKALFLQCVFRSFDVS